MLQRHEFLLTCQDILKPEYFEDKILIWFYQTMVNFYQKTKEQPTLSPVLSNELRKSIQNNEIRASEKDKYIEVLSILKNAVFSPEYIAEELVNFCRRQETKKVMLACATRLDTASDTDWDNFIDAFRKAVKLGSGKSKNLMDYWSGIEDRVKYREAESGRRVIPTGIPPLDAKLNGGLIEGQLGCWLASTGIGKSIVLPFCGKTAVEMGYRVLHFTLELNHNEVAQRYDANWANIPVHDLLFRKEEVVRNLTNKSNWLLEHYNFNDNLRIQFYPTGTATVPMLEADIRNFIAAGWVPDLVIVDYGDLLKPTTSYNDEYADLGRIFVDLRGLAGIFNVPIWTATQTNRSAMSLEVVDMDTIGDSWKKAQISDVILTLCRNKEEYEQNIIRVFGAKNRNGTPNWIIKIPTAFDRMRFFDLDTWDVWNKTKSHLDKLPSIPPPPLPVTPLNVIPTVTRRKPKVKK